MADITAEIDLDSVIDRLLEGELASPKKENMFPSRLFEMFLRSEFWALSSSLLLFFFLFFVVIGTIGVLAPFMLHLMMRETTHFMGFSWRHCHATSFTGSSDGAIKAIRMSLSQNVAFLPVFYLISKRVLDCISPRWHLVFRLIVRGNRPGKPVQLAEYEIKYLCTKAREIFINQPILLELEAPIKICGESLSFCCRLFLSLLYFI